MNGPHWSKISLKSCLDTAQLKNEVNMLARVSLLLISLHPLSKHSTLAEWNPIRYFILSSFTQSKEETTYRHQRRTDARGKGRGWRRWGKGRGWFLHNRIRRRRSGGASLILRLKFRDFSDWLLLGFSLKTVTEIVADCATDMWRKVCQDVPRFATPVPA